MIECVKNIERYAALFFDFDGVIVQSNSLKRSAIHRAAGAFCDEDTLQKFVHYFTSRNGLPRRQKIEAWFNPYVTNLILDRYNYILRSELDFVSPTPGVREFLEFCAVSCRAEAKKYVISGGEKDEIESLLSKLDLANAFDEVLCSPLTKSNHLSKLQFDRPALLFGDSKVDFEVARAFRLEFIFVFGDTQFDDWKRFFEDYPEVKLIENFC